MSFRTVFVFLSLTSLLFSDVLHMADKVVVKKSTRMLYLFKEGKIYKKYHVTLGRTPLGAKEFEGDMKTPEGTYLIDWRQASPQYYKSLHISYPNKTQKAYAEKLGVSAGSMIMLHGTPPSWSLSPYGDWMNTLLDWTEGCIAMNNDDMDEVWERTTNHTPIMIIP